MTAFRLGCAVGVLVGLVVGVFTTEHVALRWPGWWQR